MLLYQTHYLTIRLEENILKVTWKGFTDSETFRNGIEKVMQYMEERRIEKMLTDVSEHHSVSTEDQQYVVEKSLEISQRTGIKVKRALITPKDVFARFAVKTVNQKVNEQDKQERRMFENIEQALEWLKQT